MARSDPTQAWWEERLMGHIKASYDVKILAPVQERQMQSN